MNSHVEFQTCTSYHPPVGFQKKGHNEFYYSSKCGRWHARQGNFGTMILTDKRTSEKHVVKGRMPEVETAVRAILAKEQS